jgi:hypothetical protein
MLRTYDVAFFGVQNLFFSDGKKKSEAEKGAKIVYSKTKEIRQLQISHDKLPTNPD